MLFTADSVTLATLTGLSVRDIYLMGVILSVCDKCYKLIRVNFCPYIAVWMAADRLQGAESCAVPGSGREPQTGLQGGSALC